MKGHIKFLVSFYSKDPKQFFFILTSIDREFNILNQGIWFGEKINKFLDMMDLKNHTERLYSSLKLKPFIMYWDNLNNCSLVECDERNPLCSLLIILFSSHHLYKRVVIIFSKIFPKQLIKLIGR